MADARSWVGWGVVRLSFEKFDLRYISRSLNIPYGYGYPDARSRKENYFWVEVNDSIRLALAVSIGKQVDFELNFGCQKQKPKNIPPKNNKPYEQNFYKPF